VAVFLPLYTLTGIEGKLFPPLARTVTYAMVGSLVMACSSRPRSIWVFRRAKMKPTRGSSPHAPARGHAEVGVDGPSDVAAFCWPSA
jgi:multidrug efflux pump subunit AcrB